MQTIPFRAQPIEFKATIREKAPPKRTFLVLLLPLIMISFRSVDAQIQFPLVPPTEGSQQTLSAGPLQTVQGEYIIRVANNQGLEAITEGERQSAKEEVTSHSYLFYSAIALEQDIKALVKAGFVASAAKLKRRRRPRPGKRNIILSLVSDSFCEAILKRKNVVSCSPNFIIRAQLNPNDSLYPFQWGMTPGFGANATEAWNSGTASGNVVVAIADTGVDYNHPDLRTNMWKNPFDPPNGKDDDKNGYIDDVYGINAVNDTADPRDDQGHGTHVAGIIGAKGNNKSGVAGIAWTTKIMAVKFLDKDGNGTLGSALKAFAYIQDMIDKGINIRLINASRGGA